MPLEEYIDRDSSMKNCLVIVFILTVVACSSTPNVEVHYYPARGSTAFKLTRTISCDANDNPIIANHVAATVTHSADLRAPLHQLNISLLDGAMSNSDIRFEFYSDGRLKGVNATTTGQGDTTIKSAISLAAAARGIVSRTAECAFIKLAGKGKPLTLTFSKTIDDPQMGDVVKIPPQLSSQYYYSKLSTVLGTSCAVFAKTSTAKKPVVASVGTKDVSLKLKQPGRVKVAIRVTDNASCSITAPPIWDGDLVLAQFGVEYEVPIPRAAVFGKQVFAATLDESGALTLLQYAKDSSASQTLNVGKGLADSFSGDTTADKTAAIKVEADLIAQQQRLVKCLADPTNCT